MIIVIDDGGTRLLLQSFVNPLEMYADRGYVISV